MATINKDFFREAQPSELALFDLPPTQTAVENIYYQEVLPLSQVNNDSPIEFVISGQNGMEYIDMKNTMIYVKAKIKKGDGAAIASDENIGPVNLFLPALFSQVDVSLQGKPIVSTTNHYAYKAYIQTLLQYGYDAKSSQLSTQLWLRDTYSEMSDVDVEGGSNLNLGTRASYFQGDKAVDMQGPLFHDLFKMNRYLLNQVTVNVKLYRSKPEFCLVTSAASPNYKVVFEDIKLQVAKVKVNPAVIYAQSQTLSMTNAKYPFTQTMIKQMTIPSGSTNFTYDNIFQGMRPNFVCVAFVLSEAASGAYDQNPWYFQHFKISTMGLYVDGIPVNGNPLKLNYDSASGVNTIPALTKMFTTTGKWLTDSGIEISRKDVNQGYALYTFNLEPNFQNDHYLTLLKQGNVRLETTFGEALKKTISCIIYAEYPGYFEINAARDII